jgi:hypothetical protein
MEVTGQAERGIACTCSNSRISPGSTSIASGRAYWVRYRVAGRPAAHQMGRAGVPTTVVIGATSRITVLPAPTMLTKLHWPRNCSALAPSSRERESLALARAENSAPANPHRCRNLFGRRKSIPIPSMPLEPRTPPRNSLGGTVPWWSAAARLAPPERALSLASSRLGSN